MFDIYRKVAEPTINETDFWADDALDREILAEKYTNILNSIQQPFVISINAPYGTGKSFFLRRWHRSLGTDFIALFYNAWQTDFHEHALISFIASLITQMKENCLIEADESLFQRFQDISGKIISSLVLNFLSKATGDIISADDIKAATERQQGNKYFDDYNERQKNLEAFKSTLAELVSAAKGRNQKFVIFIDELERCRPTYAVELLECIKHLFDVEDIIFVLAIDRSQLQHTISNLYGNGMDSEGYLRRFIDLELTLPKPTDDQYIKHLYIYYKLNDFLPDETTMSRGGRTLVSFMTLCSQIFKLSLREIEQCFTELNIAIRSLPEQVAFYPIILTFLVTLRCRYKDIYTSLGKGNIESEIQVFRRFIEDASIASSRDLKNLEAFFLACLDNHSIGYLRAKIALHASGAPPSYNPTDWQIYEKAHQFYEDIESEFADDESAILKIKEYLTIN